jgi:hypothetical protein
MYNFGGIKGIKKNGEIDGNSSYSFDHVYCSYRAFGSNRVAGACDNQSIREKSFSGFKDIHGDGVIVSFCRGNFDYCNVNYFSDV